MPAFQYKALTASGAKKKGVVEADGVKSASVQIKNLGLVPLEIEEARGKKGKSPAANSSSFRAPRSLGSAQLCLVTRQLSTLVTAGLPIEGCLAAISSQSEKTSTQNLLASVRSSVREGMSLADSLRQFPGSFSPLYCSTVAAGEQSGHLGLVLQRLADYTEAQQDFKQRIQLALVYPVILVILSIVIVIALMVFVVPDVVEVIITAGQELPMLTKALIQTSDFLVSWGWALLIVIVLLFGGFQVLFRDEKRKLKLHKSYTKIPLIRSYSKSANSIQFISTLAIMVNSGIALIETMKVATGVVSNRFFRRQLSEALQKVKEGSSLHKALIDTKLFPAMMLHLIASGETTGELGPMLQRAATAQETELQRKVSTLVGLFEPATLLIMGVVVLTIVAAILMPILSMNQLVQ